jgi:hypothetical protein
MDKIQVISTTVYSYWSDLYNGMCDITINSYDDIVTKVSISISQPYPGKDKKFNFSMDEIEFLLTILPEIKKEISK